MSQHPSLRVDSVGVKHRNVLKRGERIKKLSQDEKWNPEKSAFGLPKVKSIKVKVKAVVETKVAAEGGSAGAAPAAAPPAAVKQQKPKAGK